MPHFFINIISYYHVKRGIEGGFTQANHGKPYNLKRMHRGDGIIFYSPKTSYPDGDPLQSFTALGYITDEIPYQVEMTPDFHPFRRNVEFQPVQVKPIKPLIDKLTFIKDKSHWGYAFRFGLFEIPKEDFDLIKFYIQPSN